MSRASEPLLFCPRLTRWWEWLRAPEVTRWQQKCRVDWDATDGRNGGAEPTVWETLLQKGRFVHRAGEKDQGAITLVLDLAEVIERVSLTVVWAWATHFNFSRKILRELFSLKDFWRRRSRPSRPSSLG